MVIKNLDKWQNYAHYLMLTGAIFIAHHYSGRFEQSVVNGEPNAWLILFLYYAVAIFVADTAIHYFFAHPPNAIKWIKWDD